MYSLWKTCMEQCLVELYLTNSNTADLYFVWQRVFGLLMLLELSNLLLLFLQKLLLFFLCHVFILVDSNLFFFQLCLSLIRNATFVNEIWPSSVHPSAYIPTEVAIADEWSGLCVDEILHRMSFWLQSFARGRHWTSLPRGWGLVRQPAFEPGFLAWNTTDGSDQASSEGLRQEGHPVEKLSQSTVRTTIRCGDPD